MYEGLSKEQLAKLQQMLLDQNGADTLFARLKNHIDNQVTNHDYDF